jgi:hypothetical protein
MATKPKRANSARPTVRTPVKSDADRVAVSHALSVSMQASPSWAQAVDVHPALTRVSKGADDLLANTKLITELKSQLQDAEAKQRVLRRDWGMSMRSLQSTVEVFAAGNADLVKSLGFEVLNRAQHVVVTAPIDLSVRMGKNVGEVIAAWKRGQARSGFVVQHATDPHNTATYSANLPSTKSTCTLSGFPSGTVVHVRVAAVDPAAQLTTNLWSDWASGTAR